MWGNSRRPDINPEVAFQPRQIMGGTASVYEPDPLPEQRNRRTIYAEKLRGLRDPFLEAFNQPGPDASCELRESSTVAPTGSYSFERGRSARPGPCLCRSSIERKEEMNLHYSKSFRTCPWTCCHQRRKSACITRWKIAKRRKAKRTQSHRSFPKKIKRTVMAEKTGEPYDFWEFLPAFESYQPDLQAQ